MIEHYSGSGEQPGTDFVMVPVPRDRIMDVYTLLAAGPAAPRKAENQPWTESSLAILIGRLTPTTEQLLSCMATHPDQWISLQDLARETGHNQADLRGALSGLRRTIKAHLGTDERPYLVSSRRAGRNLETAYQMAGATAEHLARLLSDRTAQSEAAR